MEKSTKKGNKGTKSRRIQADPGGSRRIQANLNKYNAPSTRFINQLSKKLTAHLKKNSGAPTDDFMVKAVCIQLKHYFALEKKILKSNVSPKAMKQFNDQFLLIVGLCKDLGVLPKQFIDLKRKVQITGSNDKESKEINRDVFTNNEKPIEL